MNRSRLLYRSLGVGALNLSTTGALALFYLLLLNSCTTNFNPGALIRGNTVTASTPNSGTTTDGSQGAFLITRVIPDRTFTSLLNILGDGSGTIGNFCVSTDGATSSSTSNSLCMCTFAYNTPSAPNQQIDIPVVYHETDLVRCPNSAIPSDATQVTISIHVMGADFYSNSITYPVGKSSSTLDTSDINSFAKVLRYQCRDKVWIPYLFDGSIYDPYQSEDPHLTYPLDFYTSNLGATIAMYAGGVSTHPGLEFWDCPTILTPERYLIDPKHEEAYEKDNNMNLWVYSWGNLNGDKRIYPPTKGADIDRSTFYLAKSSSGAFTVPVNAYVAPLIISGTSSDNPPLGYGVRPVVSGGNGTDTCLDTIPIPPGFRWVKVWLYRAALPPRQYVVPGTNGQSLNNVTGVLCNPGTWTDPGGGSTQKSIFESCGNPTDWNGSPRTVSTAYQYIDQSLSDSNKKNFYLMSSSWDWNTNVNFNSSSGVWNYGTGSINLSYSYQSNSQKPKFYLASRVVTYDTNNIRDPSSCFDLQIPFTDNAGSSSWVNGYDGRYLFNNSSISNPQSCSKTPGSQRPGTNCGGDQAGDYADFVKLSNQGGANTALNRSLDPLNIHDGAQYKTPRNTILKSDSLDTDSNRYDFLFVVSPPNLSLNDMIDTSPQSAGRPYQPFRYYLSSDCVSTNPINPAPNVPNDCNTESNAITHYGIKRHDVATNGDAPPSDAGDPWVFPVCAIQPLPSGKSN